MKLCTELEWFSEKEAGVIPKLSPLPQAILHRQNEQRIHANNSHLTPKKRCSLNIFDLMGIDRDAKMEQGYTCV